jgi:hypothetical protein
MHMVLSPGTYEHRCPGCGKKEVFVTTNVGSWGGRTGEEEAW